MVKKKNLGGQREIRQELSGQRGNWAVLRGSMRINALLHRFGHNRRGQPPKSA